MPTLATAAGGSIATGVWSLFGLIVVTVGGVFVAYIRQWGPWRKIANDSREADFERLRNDITLLTTRTLLLESKVEAATQNALAANQHAMRSDVKLQAALAACEILLGMVEREMPDARETAIVKRLLAQAASDDMGIGDGLRKLATIRGVGE